jgi:hypothetical protein
LWRNTESGHETLCLAKTLKMTSNPSESNYLAQRRRRAAAACGEMLRRHEAGLEAERKENISMWRNGIWLFEIFGETDLWK